MHAFILGGLSLEKAGASKNKKKTTKNVINILHSFGFFSSPFSLLFIFHWSCYLLFGVIKQEKLPLFTSFCFRMNLIYLIFINFNLSINFRKFITNVPVLFLLLLPRNIHVRHNKSSIKWPEKLRLCTIEQCTFTTTLHRLLLLIIYMTLIVRLHLFLFVCLFVEINL